MVAHTAQIATARVNDHHQALRVGVDRLEDGSTMNLAAHMEKTYMKIIAGQTLS